MGRLLSAARGSLSGMHPAKALLAGYVSYVLLGWGLLSLPSARRAPTGSIDDLFTATSAVSTTGLATVGTRETYTAFGHAVILLLIQLGGVGYMTVSSFVMLSMKRPLTGSREAVARTLFSLPDDFNVGRFVRDVVTFTAVVEGAGAIGLWLAFARAGAGVSLWVATFHSVSSFCTAGFSLLPRGLEPFRGDILVNAIVMVLSYLGAVGYIVCVDVWRRLRGRTGRINTASVIILHATAWVGLVGAVLLCFAEPSLRALPWPERALAAAFQSWNAVTTAGFNTVSIAGLSRASILLVTTLMVIGASPSGTGGGLRSTTVSTLIGLMSSALRGRVRVEFLGHEIPDERVWAAVAHLCFYVMFVLPCAYLLALTESAPLDAILFEAASAIGTVGLSAGLTASLSGAGKIVVTFLMLVGRLGPLTFGMALFLGLPRRPAPA